jgi:uncharacterized protein (DUF4415 family)
MRSKPEDRMKREYDFTGGIRGRFYQPHKVSVSVRLDDDVLLYIKKIAGLRKVRYQTLLNTLLRDYMQRGALD